jgi:hypothetical protein
MKILRSILVGLASFTFIIAVTGLVYLITLQTTVMDRTVVKGWLNESNLYDGRIFDTIVQTTNAGGGPNGAPQSTASSLNPSPEEIKAAMKATFTSEFTKTQIEGVVDNAYNWIDGTSPTFTFSIPIDQKRETLITELAKRVEPKIASLPVCRSIQFITEDSTCRPADLDTKQLATELTAQSIDESGSFAAPITNESFSKAQQGSSQQPKADTVSQLPAIHDGIAILLIALPIAAVISLLIIITATQAGHRLARVARLSRRIFFGMLFIFIPSALIVWFAKDNDFGLAGLFTAQTGPLVVPLIKTILVGTLSQLALVTGICGLMSVTAWIILSILGRTKPQSVPTAQPVPATQPFSQPSPPIQSTAPGEPFLPLPLADSEPDTNPTNYQR